MKAFPTPTLEITMQGDVKGYQRGNEGMDLRDYFAAKAMQSIITDGKLGERLKHNDYIKKVSEMSYEYADSMMEARK